MIRSRVLALAGAGAVIAAGQLIGLPQSAAWGWTGPDLLICRIGGTDTLSGFSNFGVVNSIHAYAVSSLACNIGDAPVHWDDQNDPTWNQHPVVSTGLFRLRNGRMLQIGQSWVKHAGNAVQASDCDSTCQPGGNTNLLGVGCCDAYRSVINGNQSVLGPKSEVNPTTGYFPYPFCNVAAGGISCPQVSTIIDRRLQAKDSDIDTTPGVLYFAQVHYVVPDEISVAVPPTDLNSVSYRQLTMGGNHDISAWVGLTVPAQPAIRAWKLNGLGQGVSDPDVQEYIVDVPGDGRFYFAGKASNLGGGMWHYEYAVQNYNSDRAGGMFSVPLPPGAVLTNVFFHDVDYHSGEPYSNDDWTPIATSSAVTWLTQTYAQNVNANALRWDTLYNFRFDTHQPPKIGRVTLGLFKPPTMPGQPLAVIAMLPVPDADCNLNGIGDSLDIANGTSQDLNHDGVPDECPQPCRPDVTGNGVVNVDDLLAVITSWGTCPLPPGTCPADIAPVGGDGTVNVDDLLLVITGWGPCSH